MIHITLGDPSGQEPLQATPIPLMPTTNYATQVRREQAEALQPMLPEDLDIAVRADRLLENAHSQSGRRFEQIPADADR